MCLACDLTGTSGKLLGHLTCLCKRCCTYTLSFCALEKAQVRPDSVLSLWKPSKSSWYRKSSLACLQPKKSQQGPPGSEALRSCCRLHDLAPEGHVTEGVTTAAQAVWPWPIIACDCGYSASRYARAETRACIVQAGPVMVQDAEYARACHQLLSRQTVVAGCHNCLAPGAI